MFNLSESEIYYAAPGFCAVRQLPVFGLTLICALLAGSSYRSEREKQEAAENKKKRIKIWMTGMIFMIHRKPGFLNVKFVDKDFLCLKFSIANGIFRVNGKDWFLDFQIHHLRRPQSLLR